MRVCFYTRTQAGIPSHGNPSPSPRPLEEEADEVLVGDGILVLIQGDVVKVFQDPGDVRILGGSVSGTDGGWVRIL